MDAARVPRATPALKFLLLKWEGRKMLTPFMETRAFAHTHKKKKIKNFKC